MKIAMFRECPGIRPSHPSLIACNGEGPGVRGLRYGKMPSVCVASTTRLTASTSAAVRMLMLCSCAIS